MVGERPVSLVNIFQKHNVVPNCTADGLKPYFCPIINGTEQCEPFFQRVMANRRWAIKEKVSPKNGKISQVPSVFFAHVSTHYLQFSAGNLWHLEWHVLRQFVEQIPRSRYGSYQRERKEGAACGSGFVLGVFRDNYVVYGSGRRVFPVRDRC